MGVALTLVEVVTTPVTVEANALGVVDPAPLLVFALGAVYLGALSYRISLADAPGIADPYPTDACDMSTATEGRRDKAARLLAGMSTDIGLERSVQFGCEESRELG